MKNDPSCLSCEASLGVLSAGGNFCNCIISYNQIIFKKMIDIEQPLVIFNLFKVNKKGDF
jgi:hypothetical protein